MSVPPSAGVRKVGAQDTTPERAFSSSLVDTQIPKTDMERPNDIAVVIGNRTYKNDDIPNVDYAVRDAQTMQKYLTCTLGFRKENVIYLKNASGSAVERVFGTSDDPKGQLYDYVKPEKSSVFVYYSGHGVPNPESDNAYLLPSNANPSYLSQNGYPLNQLYENLAQLPAESVSVVLEACFSGTSEGGAVVQNASPAVLSVENPVMGMKNGLAFTAGAADQVASWYPEKKKGSSRTTS
ncbi:MAG: caspase domain-containing protein [Salinibacter sp.]